MTFAPADTLRSFWTRRSRLARCAIYIAILYAALALLRRAWPGIGILTRFAGLVVLVLAFVLAVRWMRNVFMWRLRNRLIVTYTFIGVVPVLLLAAMALIAGWGFASQFATFIITSDLRGERKAVATANDAMATAIAEQLQTGNSPDHALQLLNSVAATGMRVSARVEGRGSTVNRAVPPDEVISLPAKAAEKLTDGRFDAVIQQDGHLYIRSVRTLSGAGNQLTVMTSLPINRAFLDRINGGMGELTLYPPDLRASNKSEQRGRKEDKKGNAAENGLKVTDEESGSGFIVRGSDGKVLLHRSGSPDMEESLAPLSAGRVPSADGTWDRELHFFATLDVFGWDTGETANALLLVQSRPSLVYSRVSSTLGAFLGGSVVIILAVIAIIFAIIELLALIIGVSLTRTITGSVHKLYQATQHVNRGDLSHRIEVQSRDQLATLETSFNAMTGSLELLIEEQKEKQRIESEIAIAQEVQAQLFPREITPMRTLELFGVCLPARSVSGDYYDFLPVAAEKIGIAVGDISGKGISAALLMATIHSAVRVYEFGRMPAREQLVAAGAAALSLGGGGRNVEPAELQSPAHVMELLNRHLYHSTPPEKYATLFLGLWDGDAHTLSYTNAGHLPPFVICGDGSVHKLEVGGTVIGLFDDIHYDEGSIQLKPGDLFVAYSDGVTEPENEFGEFGEDRLLELLIANRGESLPNISEVVTAAVNDWIGAAEQPDDVTLVLARAR
jgi:phosphoserine phosphatase RsbU/P